VASTGEGGGSYTLAPVVAGNMLYLLDDKGELTAYR
jgi:hypothetical protein